MTRWCPPQTRPRLGAGENGKNEKANYRYGGEFENPCLRESVCVCV